MKKISLFSAAMLMIIAACTNDKFPREYSRGEFVEGDVRLFTETGESTDIDEIADFEKRVREFFMRKSTPPAYVYSFQDDINFMSEGEMEIVFDSETSGLIRVRPDEMSEYEITGFDLTTKDDFYIISLHDTVETNSYILNPYLKCTPEIIDQSPVPGGLTRYLKPLYVKKEDDRVLVCIVSYMRVGYLNEDLQEISILGANNNLINEGHLPEHVNAQAGWSDSIAYKESFIVFKR